MLVTLLLLLQFNSAQEWQTDFKQAQNEAAQSNKLILLNFSGSDWCGPCIRLKNEIFDTEIFKGYASGHLVLVNADFPRRKKNQLSSEQVRQNDALAERYNEDGKFPYTILVNSEGKILKEWIGFPDETAAMFIQEIIKFSHAGS